MLGGRLWLGASLCASALSSPESWVAHTAHSQPTVPRPLSARQAVCPSSGQQGSMFKMGSVGTCLSKAAAGGTQLTQGCKALVLVRWGDGAHAVTVCVAAPARWLHTRSPSAC